MNKKIVNRLCIMCKFLYHTMNNIDISKLQSLTNTTKFWTHFFAIRSVTKGRPLKMSFCLISYESLSTSRVINAFYNVEKTILI